MQQVGTDGAQLPMLMGQAQMKWVISVGDVKYGSLKYTWAQARCTGLNAQARYWGAMVLQGSARGTVGNRRVTEYPQLEGAHKGHWV